MSIFERGHGYVRRGREAISTRLDQRDPFVNDDALLRLLQQDRTPVVMGKTESDDPRAIVVIPPRGCSWSGNHELDSESGLYFFQNPNTQNWRAARMRWLDDEMFGEFVMRLDAATERMQAMDPSAPPTE